MAQRCEEGVQSFGGILLQKISQLMSQLPAIRFYQPTTQSNHCPSGQVTMKTTTTNLSQSFCHAQSFTPSLARSVQSLYISHMAEVEIKALIRKNLPNWKNLANEDILLERMTGLTNQTFKASAKDHHPIVFRKFGESSQNPFLQRQSQIFVYMHVAEVGLGPKVFHYDEHIRLEQYLQSTVLPASKMLVPGYMEEVAFTLSKFHKLKPTAEKIKKESLFRRSFVQGADNILSLCHQKLSKDIFLPQEQPIVAQLKQWATKQQVHFIDQLTTKHQEDGLVFSHNDLLANNILIQKDTNHFIFIDYEYASYNYPIYDIANFIVESQVNYDVNESPFFEITPIQPQDKDKHVRFIEAYVVAKDNTHEEFKANFQSLRKEEKYQAEIGRLVQELPVGMLLSNLMWGWWSIMVCKNPNISFDYIAFARWRLEEYQKFKKIVTQ